MDSDQINKMFVLFDAVREGVITDDQRSELDALLSRDKQACKYYIEYLNMCVLLKSGKAIEEGVGFVSEQDDTIFDVNMWHELSCAEKTAPAIEIPKEKPKRELIQKVVYPAREKRKMTKFQIFTFIASAAAILFLIAFPKLFPSQPGSVEVATLVDQMDVKWSDSRSEMENGSRLRTNEPPFILEKGIVSVLYDSGVRVVIESPAEFELEQSGVLLKYGRLFSDVSESGSGFSVETPTCKFIDLGTKFGIQADDNGCAELHVIKGKVQFFAGSTGRSKAGKMVTENKAFRYNANTSQITGIPIQKEAFVRSIDSSNNLIWRGQERLSLADIVGGGNGFGTGQLNQLINPLTGKTSIAAGVYREEYSLVTAGQYVLATELPLVDGVFIPDGELGPVQITSTGIQIPNFPDTDGRCWRGISNCGEFIHSDNVTRSKAIFDGRIYNSQEQPAILMSSNAGITFDLDAIRLISPENRGFHFTALCGITQGLSEEVIQRDHIQPRADFMVYVDGVPRFCQKAMTLDSGAAEIEVEISQHERFLTLVVADCGEKSLDWAVFVNPYLELITKDEK